MQQPMWISKGRAQLLLAFMIVHCTIAIVYCERVYFTPEGATSSNKRVDVFGTLNEYSWNNTNLWRNAQGTLIYRIPNSSDDVFITPKTVGYCVTHVTHITVPPTNNGSHYTINSLNVVNATCANCANVVRVHTPLRVLTSVRLSSYSDFSIDNTSVHAQQILLTGKYTFVSGTGTINANVTVDGGNISPYDAINGTGSIVVNGSLIATAAAFWLDVGIYAKYDTIKIRDTLYLANNSRISLHIGTGNSTGTYAVLAFTRIEGRFNTSTQRNVSSSSYFQMKCSLSLDPLDPAGCDDMAKRGDVAESKCSGGSGGSTGKPVVVPPPQSDLPTCGQVIRGGYQVLLDDDPDACVCPDGWQGAPGCITPKCPFTSSGECSGNGRCEGDASTGEPSYCVCNIWWTGSACSIGTCPGTPQCSGHGECVKGSNSMPVCQCEELWDTYADCSVGKCLNDCSGNGRCHSNVNPPVCDCNANYTGFDCSSEYHTCPGAPTVCGGHGVCNSTVGLCYCHSSWQGSGCSIPRCQNNCNNKGSCNVDEITDSPVCDCYSGWFGEHCESDISIQEPGSEDACKYVDCGRGQCRTHNSTEHLNSTTSCDCYEGYRGPNCSTPYCPNECNGNGVCNIEVSPPRCDCQLGFYDANCTSVLKQCPGSPSPCSDNGICSHLSGKCVCKPGWDGTACDIAVCDGKLKMCSKQGICNTTSNNRICDCFKGFFGEDCSIGLCPKNCSGRGICYTKSIPPVCNCDREYTNSDDCSVYSSLTDSTEKTAKSQLPIPVIAGSTAAVVAVAVLATLLYATRHRIADRITISRSTKSLSSAESMSGL